MSGVLQFDRKYELIVGDLLIKELDIDFTVTRSIDENPNTISLNVFNLSEDNISALTEQKKPTVQLSAGYAEKIGVIYLGEGRNIIPTLEETDWVVNIAGGDGEVETRKARINKSFAPGVSYETVILEVAKSMGEIGLGNLQKIIKKGTLPNGAKSFPKGTTVSGQSKKELRRLLLSAGLEWSIQNRQFQVLEANKTLEEVAYVISSDTGMVGSPVLDNEGELTFRALMNADIVPGRQIEVKSRRVNGFFRTERCEYRGSTTGQDWYVDVEAKEIA